jgi:putative tryptophan/tyrosine transport system substrate-binding protein
LRAFRQGLGETGFVEGTNIAVEFRWAEDQNDRFPQLAADLVRRGVAVIVATGTPSTDAAKAATGTIPIVFLVGTDPVGVGLVSSLNRPGGNLTGIAMLNVELEPKRLELLHELVPSATTIAVLLNPTNPPTEATLKDLRAAARNLGVAIRFLHASNDAELDAAFADLAQLRPGALVIMADGFFNTRSRQLAALAARLSLPAVYSLRDFAAGGGLLSYSGDFLEGHRQVGIYTGGILKGEKPADLPVMQPTKYEFVINLKAAKTLGLTVPPNLLATADEVIE